MHWLTFLLPNELPEKPHQALLSNHTKTATKHLHGKPWELISPPFTPLVNHVLPLVLALLFRTDTGRRPVLSTIK